VTGGEPFAELDQLIYDIRHGFCVAMDEDFKISQVLALMFKTVKTLNRLMDIQGIDPQGARAVITVFKEVDQVLNVMVFSPADHPSERVKGLMEKRELARTSQEWEEADRLRDELVAMGVELHDKKVD